MDNSITIIKKSRWKEEHDFLDFKIYIIRVTVLSINDRDFNGCGVIKSLPVFVQGSFV